MKPISFNEQIKVKVTKLKEADDPLHPNNIKEGFTKEGYYYYKPVVGESFILYDELGGWATSTVQEILSENTFRTYNSIYKWEIL